MPYAVLTLCTTGGPQKWNIGVDGLTSDESGPLEKVLGQPPDHFKTDGKFSRPPMKAVTTILNHLESCGYNLVSNNFRITDNTQIHVWNFHKNTAASA